MATKTVTETIAFRAVVRGTIPATGYRARRCKVIHAETYEDAWEQFATIYRSMVKGLSDPTYQVLPPVGLKLDGTASKGYALED